MTASPPVQVSRRPVVLWSLIGALVLIAASLGAGLWASWRTRPADRPLMWLSVDVGPDARASRDFTAAISPDGTHLVFPIGDPGASRFSVRSLGQPNATPLAGTEGGDNPFFSPDGEWVAFGAGGKLKKDIGVCSLNWISTSAGCY